MNIINFSDHNLIALELKIKSKFTGAKSRRELLIYFKNDLISLSKIIEDLKGRLKRNELS